MAGFTAHRFPDCCSIYHCLSKMKQIPDTTTIGNFLNHLTEEHASACVQEAQTQRKWLLLTAGTQLCIWTGKYQRCPVQWHHWANSDFKECWCHQSWCIFGWPLYQTSRKYSSALLENVKNLVYFYTEKQRMKIAPKLNFSIRPTSHLQFPLLTGPQKSSQWFGIHN